MLLTIGMMVKNEERHLEECLESLTPIREELDTELVIVDTGSDDNTVEIAKQFTDKVYFHEWNDNFSEMRNNVISYAKGDWYFSLDGDEVINNPEGFIDFFKSGKYKNFNTALVNQKNYTDLEKDRFTLLLVPRCFKNDEDFRFEGAIHNQPQYKKPIYELDTILDHYGYIAKDNHLMEKKFNRTANILKQELEKNPENIYYWFQLSRSYAMHGDLKEALDTIISGYKLLQKNEVNQDKYLFVYIQLSKMYLINKRYGKAEEIAQKTIEIKDGYLDIYYYLAKAQYHLDKKESSLQNFKEYLKIANDFDNSVSKKDISVSNETISNIDFGYRFVIELAADLEVEKDYAISSIFKISKKKQLKDSMYPFVFICLNTNDYKSLKEFYIEKLKDEDLKQRVINILENLLSDLTIKEKNDIYLTFTDLKNNHEYSLLNKIRINLYKNKYEIAIEELDKIDFNYREDYFSDIIYYLFKLKESSTYKILTSIKEENLDRFVKYLDEKYDDLSDVIKIFIDNKIEGISELRVNKTLSRYLLGLDNEIDETNKDIIDQYLSLGLRYIKNIYARHVIKNELIYELKNEEEAFLLYIYKAFEIKESDLKQYIKYLRKALNIYPVGNSIIEVLILEAKENQRGFIRDSEIGQREIKSKVESLINNNNLKKAKDLIKKYENVFGKNIEIYSMKSIILIMEKEFSKAERLIKAAIKEYNDDFDLNYNLAFVYENKDEYNKAYEIYNKLIDEAPNEVVLKELEEKLNKLESEIDIPKNEIIYNKKKANTNNIDFKPGKISTKTLNLFKSNKHQEIINKIQELNKNREYKKILNICDYWLKKVNNKTAAIHYYAGVAFNGLSFYEKAIEHHKKALKNDKSLADIKNRNSKYQGEYNESNTNCLGCNSDDYTIVNVNNQSRVKDNKELINPLRIWVKCNNCGLIYANPIPDKDSLNKYYSLLADEDDINVENRFEFLVRMSNKRLEKIESYHNRSTLLDIGTGSGFFVGAAIDRGWEANGLELAEGNCQYAKENFNIDLINKDFYDFDPEQKYDVVTLFEVIEHLRDPVKAINKARKLLKEDGIFVLATPIRDSLYGKKAKEKNIFWTTVEHLIYFDKNVIINYLNDNGFGILESNLSEEGMGRMEFYCKKI